MPRLQQSAQLWHNLTLSQKVALAVGAVLLLVVVSVTVSTASAPKYVQLYGNMTGEDASAVVEKLKEQKVKYRLTHEGSSIEVLESSVDEVRLALAGEGLPRGGNIGFELFDKTQLGQSEFTERLNYVRALQGELARTIGELKSVRSARVHLAIPEHRLYSEEQKQPTATVVLDLAGPDPTAGEIKSVIHLVSSAVEGLTPDNVTVVDTNKKLLSDMLDQLGTGSPGSRMKTQREMAQQIEGRVQSMLDTVLGEGKSIVRADVVLNFDRKQIDRTLYNPTGSLANSSVQIGVLESQQTAHEEYGGKRTGAVGGAVGTAAMLAPVVTASTSNGKNGDYLREENTAKYAIPQTVEHVDVTPGQVERINLALFVDESVGDDQVATLRKIVTAAVGIDVARGDMIEVQPMKFDQTATKEAKKQEKAELRGQFMAALAKYGAGGLLTLAFLFMLFAIYRSTLAPVHAQELPTGLPELVMAPELPLPDVPMLAMASGAMEQYAANNSLNVEEFSDIPEEFDFTDIDPQRVAQVIRGLMAEE